MARSVPEAMTAGLAGVLDLLRVGRVLGEPVRSLLAAGEPSAAEWRELRDEEEEWSLAHKEFAVQRRFLASLAWQCLAWAWFVLGGLVTSIFFLAGNSPLKAGPAATFVFPLVMLATAATMGNWVVCLGIGRGWMLLRGPGRRNVAWLLVVVSWFAFFTTLWPEG